MIAFRGRSRGFRRGFGDRLMDGERRGEEESAPDSQDLSSAASLDRGNYPRIDVLSRTSKLFEY